MIIGAIIVGIIIIGLISLINHMSSDGSGNTEVGVFFGVFLGIFWVIEVGIVSNMIEEPKPTSMDVYRGKTTLEYTVRDGVKIDSVVVWKN